MAFDEKKELDLIVNYYLKSSSKNEKDCLKTAIQSYAEKYRKQSRSGSNIESKRTDGVLSA